MLPLDKSVALERMMAIPTFPPDYPGAIVFPAHESNAYSVAGHGGVPNQPRAFILHTPEEPADNYPSTPHWFAQYHPNQAGSTHYFASFTGDIYECVPETWGAIANGLDGKPRPAWAQPGSLNWQTLSVEIEGYAANIGQTLKVGGAQWKALVSLIRHRCNFYKIPLDRDHIMGHYQLSANRTDPGATFPWAALMAELIEEDEMKPFLAWDLGRQGWYFVGPAGAKWVTKDATLRELKAQFGPLEEKALSTSAVQALGG